ncbi:MAG: thioredoxin [Clostridia bacterium]|nr:thioredoxin [Clostridia bacterium]MBR4032086.1 thioredoxin [Clostridia bacterium]
MIIDITNENFENEVVKSEIPVLVDFWAEWCGPCRMIAPIVHEIAEQRSDIKVCKVNVDNNPQLCNQFGIDSIPTLLLFKNGEVAAKSVGYSNKAVLESFIDKNI